MQSFATIASEKLVVPAPPAPHVRVLARTRTKTLVDLPRWKHAEDEDPGCCLVPRAPRQWLVPHVDVSSSDEESV